MPKITREQYIERSKEKLRKNVTFFKTLLPGFDMTEEQIDSYVRDRLEAHLIAKASPAHNDVCESFQERAHEYMPGNYMYKEHRRSFQDMYVEGGSEAAEEYNHMLFDGLCRDDGIGEAKRKNFFQTVLNAPFELDLELLKGNLYDPELAKYCAANMRLGNLCFCFSSVIENSPYELTDKERYKKMKDFSEDAGSLMMGYTATFSSEDILSVPLDLLTREQFDVVIGAATVMVASKPKNEEEKERLRIAKYIIDHQSYQLAKYGLQGNIGEYENAHLQPYGMDDFTDDPGQEDSILGGYRQRVEKIKEHRNVLKRDVCDDPEYIATVALFEKLAKLVEGIKGLPKKKDIEKIAEAGRLMKESGARFNQNYQNIHRRFEKEGRKLAPESEEYKALAAEMAQYDRAKELLLDATSTCRCFTDEDILESLVFYQAKDDKGEAKENVPTPEQLKEAHERALAAVPQRDFTEVVNAQVIDSEDTVSGFINIDKKEVENYLAGYNGSVQNGKYILADRFEIALNEVISLNDRTDSPEMLLVKSEINRLKQLSENGMTPEDAKAAIDRVRFVCDSYVNNPSKRHNDRWHAVNNALMNANEALEGLKEVRAADEVSKASDEIRQRLEHEFAEAEAVTGGAVNRLDSVMIAGKTLRGWLTEEVIRRDPAAAEPDYNLTEAEIKAINEPEPEHIAQLILAAMIEGKKVEFFRLDPNNGYCINNTDGKPEMEIKKPSILENADKLTLKRIRDGLAGKTDIDFAKKTSKEENWARIDICRTAVKRLNNSVQSEAGFANEYKRQLFELWSATHPAENGAPAKVPQELAPQLQNSSITITRGAIPSFTIGYMITKMNMSIKDIFDPTAKRAEKAEAVEHIVDLFTKDIKDEALNNARLKEIADIAVNGCDKLYNGINSVMSAIDINSDEQLFSSGTRPLFGMMCAAHDMYQDGLGGKNGMMRGFWNEALAAKNGCEVGSPEAEAAQKEINHKAAMMDVINRTSINEKRLAMMGTGCRPDKSNAAYEILTSEFMRRNVAKKTAQTGDYFDCVTDEELSNMTQFGVRVSNLAGTDGEKFVRDYTSLLPDFAPDNLAKFAGAAFKGYIRNDLIMQQDEKGVLVVNRERFRELNKKLGDQHMARTDRRLLDEGMAELSRNVAENVRRIDEAHPNPVQDDPQPKLPQ